MKEESDEDEKELEVIDVIDQVPCKSAEFEYIVRNSTRHEGFYFLKFTSIVI